MSDPAREPGRLRSLLYAVIALALALSFGWLATLLGAKAAHWIDVRSWDARRCEITGRHVVEYPESILPGFRETVFHTFAFDLRDLESGRLYRGSLGSPYPPRHPTPRETRDEWVGDMPFTEVGCRVDPEGARAYLRAEPWSFVSLVAAATLAFAAMALVCLLGAVLWAVGSLRRE